MSYSNTIGALILTRNSQANIQATINSVSLFANQIVVIDTGSTDSTVNIALRSGAEVYFFKWVDDFSAARNFAIQHLHTDWVLMIDSDELLSSFDNNIFQSIASNLSIGGINFVIENTLTQNGNTTMKSHRYTRLFKNQYPEIKYSGRIHEQIRESIEQIGYQIYESDFKILHLGYDNYSEDKNQRNLHLLESDSSENPEDDWLKFHLAETHFSGGRYKEAENLYKIIFNSEQLSLDQAEISRIRLAQIALNFDDYNNITNLTNFTAHSSQNEALRLYVRGTAFIFMKQKNEALICLEQCLEINSPVLIKDDIIRAINYANNINI